MHDQSSPVTKTSISKPRASWEGRASAAAAAGVLASFPATHSAAGRVGFREVHSGCG